MKNIRIILAALVVAVLSSCSAVSKMDSAGDPAMDALVDEAVNAHDFSIEVDYIIPMRGPGRMTSDGYRLTVKDGKATSYLPFFGVSHGVAGAYGIEPAGIEFKDYPVKIDDSKSKPEKGKYVYNFVAKSGSERVVVDVTFWDNGSAQIFCKPENRSAMSYSGTLTKLPEPRRK